MWSQPNQSADPCQFQTLNVPAGNFNVSVTNNGNTLNYCVVVNPLLLPGIPNFTVVNPSCLGNDGSIAFNVGTFNVNNIVWSNGAMMVNTITGLVPGAYFALIEIISPDGNFCGSIFPFNLPAYTPLTVTASVLTDFCANVGPTGTGTVLSVGSGGSGLDYNFAWNGPATISTPTNETTNITGGIGCFNVTVTDALLPWCTATDAVQLAPPCSADYDCNGVININDLLYFAASYGQFSPTIGDLDCNAITNINDFLIFSPLFGAFCP